MSGGDRTSEAPQQVWLIRHKKSGVFMHWADTLRPVRCATDQVIVSATLDEAPRSADATRDEGWLRTELLYWITGANGLGWSPSTPSISKHIDSLVELFQRAQVRESAQPKPEATVPAQAFKTTEEWLHTAEADRDQWMARATRWAVEARIDNDRAKDIEAKARKAMGDAIAKLLPFSDISHGDECPARFCEDNNCDCPDGEEETAHRTDDLCECTVGVIVRAIDDLRFAFAPEAEVMPSSRAEPEAK